MAGQIWAETHEALCKLRQEQAEIMSCMGPLYTGPIAQQLNHRPTAARVDTLLAHVAQLSENAQLQMEVTRSAMRKLVWQVCSPADMIRLTCFNWPSIPDFLLCLQILAAEPATSH